MSDLHTDDLYAAPEMTMIRERVVVAPRAGRFIPLPPETFTTEGEWAHEGQVLAEVRSGVDKTPVISLFSGWVMGMLCIPGQPVEAGEPLFWIRT